MNLIGGSGNLSGSRRCDRRVKVAVIRFLGPGSRGLGVIPCLR